MSKQKDERKHERKQLEVTVDWQLLGTDDVMWSSTDDVGPGGLRIRTLTPPQEGSQVVVVMGPPDRSEGLFRIPARVAWTRMDDDFCGMGIAFEPESDEEKAALEELVGQIASEG